MHSSNEPEDRTAPLGGGIFPVEETVHDERRNVHVGNPAQPDDATIIQIPPRPAPAPGSGRDAGAGDAAPLTEEEERQKALEWKRKAASRRMKAGHTEADEDFLPVFTPRRMPDMAPGFDQDPAMQLEPEVKRAPPGYGRLLIAIGGIVAVLLAVRTGAQFWETYGLTPAEALPVPPPQKEPEPDGVDPAPAAKRLVEAFFVARTPEEKVPLVRGGEAMLPVMREYYAVHPDEPSPFRCDPDVVYGGDDLGRFVVIFGSDGERKRRITAVESTPAGEFFDWRVLTGAGDMDWADWIRLRPARRVSQRIMASLDDYYGGRFVDQDRWLCVRATDITGNWTVWGYAERESTTGEFLRKNLRRGAGAKRLVGNFEFPAGPNIPSGGAAQVLLHSVEDTWIDRSPGRAATGSKR